MSQRRLSFFPNLFFLQCLFSGTSNFVVTQLEGWALLFSLVSLPPHPTPIPIQSFTKFYQFSCPALKVQLPNSLRPFYLLFNSSYLCCSSVWLFSEPSAQWSMGNWDQWRFYRFFVFYFLARGRTGTNWKCALSLHKNMYAIICLDKHFFSGWSSSSRLLVVSFYVNQ